MNGYSQAFNGLYGPKPIEGKNKMNERIRELAIQTDIWCDQNVAQGSPAYNNLWEQKFAELIIRECARKVTRNEALNILEHFGVEE